MLSRTRVATGAVASSAAALLGRTQRTAPPPTPCWPRRNPGPAASATPSAWQLRPALRQARHCSGPAKAAATTAEAGPGVTQAPPQGQGGAEGAQLLWDDCDTAKEIRDVEATEGFEDVEVLPEHYALGVRAFAWGTVLAALAVSCISAVGGWYLGFSSVWDAVDFVKGAPEREAARLAQEGGQVYHHHIDLMNPSSWSDTWAEIISDLERIEAENKAKQSE